MAALSVEQLKVLMVEHLKVLEKEQLRSDISFISSLSVRSASRRDRAKDPLEPDFFLSLEETEQRIHSYTLRGPIPAKRQLSAL